MRSISFIVALAAFPVMAQAGEVTGGAFSAGTSGGLDNSNISFNRFGVNAEIGFSQNFAVQGDFSTVSVGEGDTNAITSIALHSIYHMNDQTSFGVFGALDHSSESDARSLGIEAGLDTGSAEGEVYIGGIDIGTDTGTVIGAVGLFDVTETLAMGLGHDRMIADSGNLSTTELRAEYAIENFIIEADIGQLESADGTSETMIGLGARITFGADRGATFNRRGLANLIPGL